MGSLAGYQNSHVVWFHLKFFVHNCNHHPTRGGLPNSREASLLDSPRIKQVADALSQTNLTIMNKVSVQLMIY
jgi:hypothetical protein